MSRLSDESEHFRPLRSFTGGSSLQDESMATSTDYHSLSDTQPNRPGSVRSFVTDEDLEVARQKLLLAQAEDEDPEISSIAPLLPESESPPMLYQGHQEAVNGGPHRTVAIETPLPDNHSRTSRYGSVSMSVSNRRKTPLDKRYRLPLLILLGFDWGMVVFLSIICFVLKVRLK